MYGYSFNTSVDKECEVEIIGGRKFRVHETGYIEGDTNGFVEGDYEIFEIDENGDWYFELSVEEGEKWIAAPYDEQPETMCVFLQGRKGKKAFSKNFGSRKNQKPFRYKGKSWRVYKLEHIRNADGSLKYPNGCGYINNYKAIYHLVTFGAMTVYEAIQEAAEGANWTRCGCQ